MYFRNAAAAIIVYDVTSKQSLSKVEEWAKLIRENAEEDITIGLVGNKADLIENIEVTLSEGKRLARTLCINTFAEVSAKENIGIDEFLD